MIRKIDSNIKNFIEARNIYVLRDKTTGNALHVSYTEDGLRYATNPITGKLRLEHHAPVAHGQHRFHR